MPIKTQPLQLGPLFRALGLVPKGQLSLAEWVR